MEMIPIGMGDFGSFIERRQMMAEDSRNRIKHMIGEQTPENLAILRDLFEISSRDSLMAAYMEGVFATTLAVGHPERCERCGQDHLDHSDYLLSEEPVETTQSFIGPIQPTLFDDDEISAPEQNLLDQLGVYGVYPVDVTQPTGRVTCINCGMTFSSLEDRMMRPPKVEGCSGCQQKAKFG